MANQKTVKQFADEEIAGQCSSVEEANRKMRLASRYCRLIGGASQIPMVVGHSVVFSVIPIDMGAAWPLYRKDGDPQRYGVPGVTLKEIACALGIEWDSPERIDNGSDQLFAHIKVTGKYRQVDGTFRPVGDEYRMDARDGSYQLAGKTERQIASLRGKVLERAITGAKLRAVRDAFGVPHAVLEEELEVPFVVARLQFTGQAEDPRLRMMFGATIVQDRLLAMQSLYGPSAAEGIRQTFGLLMDMVRDTPAATLPTGDGAGYARLPSQSSPMPAAMLASAAAMIEQTTAKPAPVAPPPAPVAPPPAPVAPPPAPVAPEERVIPAGAFRGKKLGELADSQLQLMIDHFAKTVADPTKATKQNQQWLDDCTKIMAERVAQRPAPSAQPPATPASTAEESKPHEEVDDEEEFMRDMEREV